MSNTRNNNSPYTDTTNNSNNSECRQRHIKRETWTIDKLYKSNNNERRPSLKRNRSIDLTENILKHGVLHAPKIDPKGGVFCGWGRVEACEDAEIPDIDVDVYHGYSDEEQQDISVSENTIRRDLTKKDIEEIVRKRIKRGLNDSEIQRKTGIPRETVGHLRIVFQADNEDLRFRSWTADWKRADFRRFSKKYRAIQKSRPELVFRQRLTQALKELDLVGPEKHIEYYRQGTGELPGDKNTPPYDEYGAGYEGQTTLSLASGNRSKFRKKKPEDQSPISFGLTLPTYIHKAYESYARSKNSTPNGIISKVLSGSLKAKVVLKLRKKEKA
jgi:hypothetical protein